MQPLRLIWAGGEHEFRLRLRELRGLQTRTDAGPYALLRRVQSGDWRIDDLLDTLRLGLIGGGMQSGEAATLVARMAETHPPMEFTLPAQAVLAHALMGPPASDDGENDEDDGEPEDAPPEKPEGVGSGTSLDTTGPAR